MGSVNISENIKKARSQKGITQKELAKRLKVSPAYYNKLEKRGGKITLAQIEQIANAIGVESVSLTTDKDFQNLNKAYQEAKKMEQSIKMRSLQIDRLIDILFECWVDKIDPNRILRSQVLDDMEESEKSRSVTIQNILETLENEPWYEDLIKTVKKVEIERHLKKTFGFDIKLPRFSVGDFI